MLLNLEQFTLIRRGEMSGILPSSGICIYSYYALKLIRNSSCVVPHTRVCTKISSPTRSHAITFCQQIVGTRLNWKIKELILCPIFFQFIRTNSQSIIVVGFLEDIIVLLMHLKLLSLRLLTAIFLYSLLKRKQSANVEVQCIHSWSTRSTIKILKRLQYLN